LECIIQFAWHLFNSLFYCDKSIFFCNGKSGAYMKRLTLLSISLLALFISAWGQTPEWKYVGEIKFSPSDTANVTPYLCSVDGRGRLYVASSKATSAKAHNAIYYCAKGATEFKKLVDYDNNGDSDTLTGNIGAIRGLTTLGTDVYVVASQPYPKTKPNTLAATYVYPNADTTQLQKFGSGIQGAGYGTYVNGAAMTRDTFMFCGIPFNTSIRFYNFNYSIATPVRGSWVAITGAYPGEPGGAHTGGYDVIRDVATLPNGDYTQPETPFYTSRNSYASTSITGGIASWSGGSQSNCQAYTGTRITDFANELKFDKAIPYGITVDRSGTLWVAGTDTSRRWIHGYTVFINVATKIASLPSKTSAVEPNPAGAPLHTPSDVAFDSAGTTAYVTDEGSGKVFKFVYTTSGIDDKKGQPSSFILNQNYPNPFNPATTISYSLNRAGTVKLFITNALGEIIDVLQNGHQEIGTHVKVLRADELPSGIYYYTLLADGKVQTRKMCVLK
jgi:hypothetical protein